MLTDLRIENFKSWEDTGSVRLAPITVFFGTNSSGKSSIGQFLLLLKQTVESTDRNQVLRTSDRDVPADIGDFQDFIHHHDVNRALRFSLNWSQEKPVEIDDVLDRQIHHASNLLSFSAEISGGDTPRERMRVDRMKYALRGEADQFSVSMEPVANKPQKYQLTFDGFTGVRVRQRAWPLPGPTRFYGFPDEAVAYYQNTDFLPDLSLALERQLRAMTYLGPLRVNPERTYTWLGGAPDDVGWAGEKTVDALLAGQSNQLNLKPRGRLRSLQYLVADQLRALGLVDSFDVKPIARGRPEHEVRVVVAGGTDEVLLTDVGFGISQVLPVLVQSLYAPIGSTLLVEQPELHLHPSVQKGLADFLVSASKATQPSTSKKSVPRNIQFLIESHSEHFLRRLQRLVAEEQVDQSQVALYFAEMVKGRSRLRQLDLDLFGNINNWPKDFFGDPIEDIAGQAEAQLLRQIDAQ
jgi:predicted ATPase